MADLDVAAIAAKAQADARRKAVARVVPEPEPEPEPVIVRHREPEPGWLRVERVRLNEDHAVATPGREKGIYPSASLVLEDNPTLGERTLVLWLDPARNELIVEHPVSGCRERVPVAGNVRQYRLVGDHPGEPGARPVGMVRSLRL